MPVALQLTNEEIDAVQAATKAAKVEVAISGKRIQLTTDNFGVVRDACKALHAKKRSFKTRTVLHLEACFNLENVLNKMERLAGDFGVDPATFSLDAENDNTIGVVVDNTVAEAPAEVTEVTTEEETNTDGDSD